MKTWCDISMKCFSTPHSSIFTSMIPLFNDTCKNKFILTWYQHKTLPTHGTNAQKSIKITKLSIDKKNTHTLMYINTIDLHDKTSQHISISGKFEMSPKDIGTAKTKNIQHSARTSFVVFMKIEPFLHKHLTLPFYNSSLR